MKFGILNKLVIIVSGIADMAIKSIEAVHSYQSALTYALFGVGSLLSALFIIIVDPYNMLYEWKIKFGPGAEIFSFWEKPPVELFLKVYLWNITNSEEYMSGKDTKLKFQEVGPYTYREYMTHENVTFNDNGTLSSIPNHPLVWEPALSNGHKEDDLLILPNIALLSIADVVSQKSIFTRLGLNVIIRQTNSQPLVKMTAREFMFGYKSALMTLGNTFMPSWVYFDKLGLIDRMYEFRGDYETVFTGTKHGLGNIGLADTYNGASKLPQWDSPCGDITNSSDGTKFPGYIKPNDTLLFFRKSMCRAKALVHVNDTNSDGFNAYVYHFANDTDDNGRIHQKNRCFCKEKDINQCKPNGLLDVRGCYYGFPIALSYPHFYQGDPVLFDKVESGLNPDPEKHRSFFVIEPNSGTPLNLAVRYQINMALGNLQNIANSEKFSNMVLPMLWIEIGMYGLPSWLRIRLKIYLQIAPIVQTCLMYGLFITSVLALWYSLHKFLSSRKTIDTDQDPWIEDDLVLNLDRKLSSYIPEKRASLTPRELKVYFNSLVSPLNQVIDCTDYEGV
ncbi:scavenger receptor class B member 1-like isoform X2 [Anthonomus grandis grandis]|uniref:scavenger receptor class B member 1-like isoform X2 n=1 Tax=Anthonomus grandis grandis TaxID=2921223 RepID=UPI0021662C4D|nr:scavenger receptor class B member 1-like isoform X2 [Anthonomus grandis grandis]